MQRSIRTAALTAILLVPLVTSAPADWRALNSAQPAASYTYQGTVRAVDARTGSIELITGVGMSLRVVRMTFAPRGGAPPRDWSSIGSRSSRWGHRDPAGRCRPRARGPGLSEARKAGRSPPRARPGGARPVRSREGRVRQRVHTRDGARSPL